MKKAILSVLFLMGLAAILHLAILGWCARHDVISCLMSPGAHTSMAALFFSCLFLMLRMAVLLLFPGLALSLLLVLFWLEVMRRTFSRPAENKEFR